MYILCCLLRAVLFKVLSSSDLAGISIGRGIPSYRRYGLVCSNPDSKQGNADSKPGRIGSRDRIKGRIHTREEFFKNWIYKFRSWNR